MGQNSKRPNLDSVTNYDFMLGPLGLSFIEHVIDNVIHSLLLDLRWLT